MPEFMQLQLTTKIIIPPVFLLTSSKGRPSLNIILSSADIPLGRSPPVAAATSVVMVVLFAIYLIVRCFSESIRNKEGT